MKDKLKKFDGFLINLINHRMKNPFLDKFMYRITDLGGAIFTTLFSSSLVILGDNKIRMIGLEALAVLALSQIVVHSLKVLLGRERPYKMIQQLHTFGIDLKDYSFPSGHTTASFSIATVLAFDLSIRHYNWYFKDIFRSSLPIRCACWYHLRCGEFHFGPSLPT